MNRPLVEKFRRELIDLTSHLIEQSIVDDQNSAVRRDLSEVIVLEAPYWSADDRPDIYAAIPYGELHTRFTSDRAYDLRFLDGGLAQFRFEFSKGRHSRLLRSRLAYLPSPDLTPYQEDPEIYLHDEIFGDVVDLRSVTTPIRFDYNSFDDVVVDLHHPAAHLTLGQYPHCRIATSGPITPYYFVEFILRSFYRTADWLATDRLPTPYVEIPQTITTIERSLLHIGLPTKFNRP